MPKSPIVRPNKTHRPWQRAQRTYFYAVPRREYAYAGAILAQWWKQAPPTEALDTMARLLDPGSEPNFRPRYAKGGHATGTHAFHLHRELTRLKQAGVTPWAALLTFCAVFCRVWADPRKIGDGIGLTYAMTAEVFKLARLRPQGRHWNSKRQRFEDREGYLSRSAWRSWGTQARTELRAFLMQCFEYVAAHPCRRILAVNREEDFTAEQARARRDRRERKALDRALAWTPSGRKLGRKPGPVPGSRRWRQQHGIRPYRIEPLPKKEQPMTEMARREPYVAPAGTSSTPVPWSYDGDGRTARDEPMDAQPPDYTIEEAAARSSAHVQGATMAPRPNFTGINPAILAQYAEQAKAEATVGEDTAEPTEEEAIALAKELGADRNYPLGRARVIGVWRERRK